MGRKCCCSDCKFCSECDDAPVAAKYFDFTKFTITFTGFQDWVYDQTYNGEFGTPYVPSLQNHAGYKPGDTTYNKNFFSFNMLSTGNASIRYKLSLTNLNILNGTYTFTKGNKTCEFFPDGEYRLLLGQVTAESFFEFNMSGDLYSYFPVPLPILSSISGTPCNTFPFGCFEYRERFHSSPIPTDWSGKIGTKIIFDVYAIPLIYAPDKSSCGSYDTPIIFEFRIRETEPIATGVYANYGKKQIQEISETPCFTRGMDGCPVSSCSWSTYNLWSSCLAPFDNSVMYDYDVKHTVFQYQDTRYPNQNCWRQCSQYLNHTNFSPFFNLGSLSIKQYLFLIDDENGVCDRIHTIALPSQYFSHICTDWNDANQTIYLESNFSSGFESLYSATATVSLDNSKIESPCSTCGAGTGIGYSENFKFFENIFSYIFSYGNSDYQPPGVDDGGTTIPNETVPVPTILSSQWGSGFVLNTTNGYIPPFDNPLIPPSDIYACGLSRFDVPNNNWTLVSNLISSAWITGTTLSPRFVLTKPLDNLMVHMTYE